MQNDDVVELEVIDEIVEIEIFDEYEVLICLVDDELEPEQNDEQQDINVLDEIDEYDYTVTEVEDEVDEDIVYDIDAIDDEIDEVLVDERMLQLVEVDEDEHILIMLLNELELVE